MIAVVLAASVSVPALAQDQEGHRHGDGNRGEHADQMRQPQAERGEREHGGGWRQRGMQAQAPAATQQAPQAQVQSSDRNAWRAQREQQAAPNGAARGGWQRGQPGGQATVANNGDGRGRQGWRGGQQGQVQTQAPARRWDRNGDGRSDWQGQQQSRNADRNGDGRPDWRGQQQGRNWDRNGDGRPDYRGRYDGQRYGSNSRFDHSRDNWNRNWRSDRRYDWQRYRAENRFAYRLPRYSVPNGWNYGYQRFSIGIYLDALLWDRDYWIDDSYDYRLPPAYPPYRWVRYYNDALLIDTRDGYVVDVINDLFW